MEEPSPLQRSSDSPPGPNGVWREEVQARVAGYRRRRGRRIEGAFSMRFPFPPIEPVTRDSETAVVEAVHSEPPVADRLLPEPCPVLEDEPPCSPSAPAETAVELASDAFPECSNAADAAPEIEAQPAPARPRAKRKVIAFPQPSAPEPSDHVAELVTADPPRILEVPEELQAFAGTPLLDGLQFPTHARQTVAAPKDRIDLPLRPVQLSRRLYAGLMDCALVSAGFAVLGAVSYVLLPRLTLTKPVLLTATSLLVSLWAVYQYLFLIYRTTTVGMHLAGIRLSAFNGGAPGRRQRRSRVIALYFSTASLMMGLLWALVDVDALCWHDRISQTYLVPVR